MLDKQQLFWIDRLLPGLPPLTMVQLRQAALQMKDGGIGHTVLSDVIQPAYLGSRLDTADAVATVPRMRDAVADMQDCSTLLADQVAANQVPAPLGATGWGVPTLRTLTRRKRNTPYRVTFTSAADAFPGQQGMRVLPTFQ
jgi:hypothetical protein